MPDTVLINNNLDLFKKLVSRNLDSAKQVADVSYSVAQKINYRRGISKSLFCLGKILLFKDKNDSALNYFRLALKISRETSDLETEAEVYLKMNVVYQAKGQKDSMYFSLFKALKIFEKIQNSVKVASVYNSLGELSCNYGDYKASLEYLDKAKNILKVHTDSLSLATTYVNYGIVYYYTDKYESALENFLKAKTIHEWRDYQLYLAKDLNYLGLCYEAMSKDKLARLCFSEAQYLFKKLQMTFEYSQVLYNTGIYFWNRKEVDSAITYFEKTLHLLANENFHTTKLSAYSMLAEAYASIGKHLEAYNYHIKYSNLNDSLLNMEKVKQIAEMQTKYDTEKKEQQITLLDEQNKTKTAQRNVLIASSIVLLVLFLGSGIYFIQRNRLAKKNEQIAREEISGLLKEQEIKSYNAMIEGQEEERKRIATDLHDRLGSMLSTVKLLFSSLDEKIDKNQQENRTQYNQATGILDEAVLEVRRISHNLSTGMVNTFGLVPALEELCESIDNSKIIKCKLLCYGMENRLDQQTEIGLFRMVQELVNNALKHSKAKQLTIQLNRTSESLNLTVEDDGVGFDLAEKMKSNGMGLKNLEARAAKLNGAYFVDSKPGRGTISIIEVPLSHDTNTNS